MIGDLIDDDDENDDYVYWEHYLLHAKIVDEVFAPVTSVSRADYLELLIQDFLHDFKVLYPNRPLTPKMHYLLHAPDWIKWLVQLIFITHACTS